ncbi:hypothetical protein SLS62_010236 [Diatrype stigma]|uniref:Metallo-beta-lactamase domain-containing protein n=1 Tax=Diatrype stigma TaxID=117547 RepID=A0AAN9YGW5_9PEZI
MRASRAAFGTATTTTTRKIQMASQQLVPLPEVERLSPACIRILGGNPGKFTLQGTNTYLLGTGPERLLVDTGEGKPSWIAALKRTLEAERARVREALVTHWHPDHVGGIAQLLEHAPGTAVYKHSPATTGGSLHTSDDNSGGGSNNSHQQTTTILNIEDGQTFAVEGARLTAVHTPGHTTDHMAFVVREDGEGEEGADALLTGDNVLGQGTAVFEDLGTYLRSLARMEGLVSGGGGGGGWRAYPGHGPALPDARAKISEYIRHRHQREVQVLQTLASEKEEGGRTGSPTSPATTTTTTTTATGSEQQTGKHSWWSSMELVKVIYRDVPESLHLPARGGVVQILRKLRAEDKVVLEGEDSWRLKDRSSSL